MEPHRETMHAGAALLQLINLRGWQTLGRHDGNGHLHVVTVALPFPSYGPPYSITKGDNDTTAKLSPRNVENVDLLFPHAVNVLRHGGDDTIAILSHGNVPLAGQLEVEDPPTARHSRCHRLKQQQHQQAMRYLSHNGATKQHEGRGSTKIGNSLVASSRTICGRHRHHHRRLYTLKCSHGCHGDDSPPRIGFISCHHPQDFGEERVFSSLVVTQKVTKKWVERLTHIFTVELLAATVRGHRFRRAKNNPTNTHVSICFLLILLSHILAVRFFQIIQSVVVDHVFDHISS